MELNLKQSESEGISPCPQCGQEFEQPLLAELLSGDKIEEYRACPRCLSKVGGIEHERRIETIATEPDEYPVEETPRAETTKAQEMPGCPYHVGYLRKRAKGAPIPEGCLTCSKMIECF